MTILETFIRLRDDIKLWVANNLNTKANQTEVDEIKVQIGDTPVSEQISLAVDSVDFPVDSVNGKTGAVVLTAEDVGALTPNDIEDLATVVQLDAKADLDHSHDDIYDAKGSANIAEQNAKTYADNAANTVKNDLLNGAGEAYDTLKELGDLINENTDAIEALEIIASGKANADHTHNDIYYTETEIDEKVATINTSISNSLNDAKSYSNTNLNTAQTYTDNAVAQKSQVQIITWEADD